MGPVLLAPGVWPLTTRGLPLDTSAATPATQPRNVTYRVEDPFGRVATAVRYVGDGCVVCACECVSLLCVGGCTRD